MDSRRRIGLYGSGEVPRSRRWARRSVGPKSNGLRDLGDLPPIRRVRPTRFMTKAVAAVAIGPLATVMAIVATVLFATSMVPVITIDDEQVPPPPYSLFGYVFDIAGAPALNAQVTVTNLATSQSLVTTSDPDFGIYLVNLVDISGGAAPAPGTMIRVEGQLGLEYGINESAVPDPIGPGMQIDLHMTTVIPEFADVAIPVMGMIGMFAIVAMVARSKKDE